MQRPKSATVFGILNIAFAAMGVFGLIFSIIMLRVAASNHSAQLIKQSPVLLAWTKISMPFGFLSMILLLLAGIGLLTMKNWGRILSIIYGIYALVSGLIGLVLIFLFMVIPMIEKAQQANGPEAIPMVVGAVAGMIGSIIALVYPVLLLIFMTRPKLVEAFRVAEVLSSPGQGYPPAA